MFIQLFKKIARKTFSQGNWEDLFLLSLHEMNIGRGTDFKDDGELFVMNYIRDNFEKETHLMIFDVGANTGLYAKTLSEVLGDSATIHSFEPSRDTFQLLQKTTAYLNNHINNNFGFSDREDRATLYSNAKASGMASVYHRKLDHFGIHMNQTEEIQLTTIDSYCEKNGIDHIHFLKLDIEGHELSALRGANTMLSNNKIDFIQFEFGGCNIDSATFFKDFYYLLSDKYTIHRILENGLFEIPVYKETLEIFTTTNFLAIRKPLNKSH